MNAESADWAATRDASWYDRPNVHSDKQVHMAGRTALRAEPAQSPYRVVAYRIDHRPLSLLCLEHAEDWAGLTPVTSEDLPDGGLCTWHDCGRDVLADS